MSDCDDHVFLSSWSCRNRLFKGILSSWSLKTRHSKGVSFKLVFLNQTFKRYFCQACLSKLDIQKVYLSSWSFKSFKGDLFDQPSLNKLVLNFGFFSVEEI